MNAYQLFGSYYVKFRGDASVPDTTDPEWAIFLSFANDAIEEWRNTDGVLWNELFNTVANSDGATSITVGTTSYPAPSDMDTPGTSINIYGSTNGSFSVVPVIQPYEAVNQALTSNFAYFTGDPNNGFTLNYNLATVTPGTYNISYGYYKKPTKLALPTDFPQMKLPMYISWYALRERLENSRNSLWQKADQNASQTLADMVVRNSMGTNFNSWTIGDSQGGGFGAPSTGLGGDILLNG